MQNVPKRLLRIVDHITAISPGRSRINSYRPMANNGLIMLCTLAWVVNWDSHFAGKAAAAARPGGYHTSMEPMATKNPPPMRIALRHSVASGIIASSGSNKEGPTIACVAQASSNDTSPP